jgi:hypothetical protein
MAAPACQNPWQLKAVHIILNTTPVTVILLQVPFCHHQVVWWPVAPDQQATRNITVKSLTAQL